jgi:hypothetical protein
MNFLKHITFKHTLPTLAIFFLIVFGLGANKTLAPMSIAEDSSVNLTITETKSTNFLGLNDAVLAVLIVLGLIIFVAVVYNLVYNKIHYHRWFK